MQYALHLLAALPSINAFPKILQLITNCIIIVICCHCFSLLSSWAGILISGTLALLLACCSFEFNPIVPNRARRSLLPPQIRQSSTQKGLCLLLPRCENNAIIQAPYNKPPLGGDKLRRDFPNASTMHALSWQHCV